MLTILRRLALLWMFLFWQGGFVFYGAVVVPIGSEVLRTDFAQGLITRHVAVALNVTGLIVLLAWIWDLVAERDSHLRLRWSAWCVMAISLALLFWLHPRMDALIDVDAKGLVDRAQFRHLHRWYLRIATTQWVASIAFTFWTLQAWRAADRGSKLGPTILPHN